MFQVTMEDKAQQRWPGAMVYMQFTKRIHSFLVPVLRIVMAICAVETPSIMPVTSITATSLSQ